MKKSILAILALILLCTSLVSCRLESDSVLNPNAFYYINYSSYTQQFETIWSGLNSSYVFWDVDNTDWDAKYKELKPKFENLDAKSYVNFETEVMPLYADLFEDLVDSHFTARIYNIKATSGKPYAEFTPYRKRLSERDNYQSYENGLLLLNQSPDGVTSVEEKAGALLAQREGNIITGYIARYEDFESVKHTVWDSYYITRIYTLEDGSHVYYLCINQYKLSDVLGTYLRYSPSEIYSDYDNYYINYAHAVDSMFRTMKNDSKLAGFILDNRSNNGGYNTDMNFILGNMITEPVTVMETRVKEGIGRYDKSAWGKWEVQDCYFIPYYRDLQSEGIPYVALCDTFSTSLAEISSLAIASLDNGYSVGERTVGAMGSLYTNYLYDATYGGSFGNDNESYHYINTSTFESRTPDTKEILEGIGYTPDYVVNRKDWGVDNSNGLAAQLNKAFELIINNQKAKD